MRFPDGNERPIQLTFATERVRAGRTYPPSPALDGRMRTKRGFEVSVDIHTKGRKLDGYTVRHIDGHEVLLDPDLLKLPIELV
ncbi:MAG: hypothetical protein ACI9C1_003500 [Candidatus Aldehydirespiratoraceae bacterium]|jgi:hypothetical protein